MTSVKPLSGVKPQHVSCHDTCYIYGFPEVFESDFYYFNLLGIEIFLIQQNMSSYIAFDIQQVGGTRVRIVTVFPG